MTATLVFAGGGTGGHVFPMLAVAEAVAELSPGSHLLFVGTGRGLEGRLVPERGYPLELVDVRPMRGGGLSGVFSGAWSAAAALPAARALLARHAPSAVFSIGGYAAGPVALAGRTLGIPLSLMEPNAEMGIANRLIAPFVQRAYTAFPETVRHFGRGVVLETGVPLRAGFAPAPYGLAPDSLRVLVLGGSQGARSLNEAVPRALGGARPGGPRLSVVHQCGAAALEATRALYASFGLDARVVAFLEDMPSALAEADLVVGRAGASSLAEICAVGRPSVLVPYPHAGDHQRKNAESLVRGGAAVALLDREATPARLGEEIARLAADPARLVAMAAAARSLGRPDAARVVARDLLDLAGLAPVPAGTSAPRPMDPTPGAPLGFAGGY